MRFPLADWIAAHSRCRHNLGQSGMYGSIRRPPLTRDERGETDPDDLVEEWARLLHVSPDRIALTHGATEANAWVTTFLAQGTKGRSRTCRVRFPEYPSLFDVARWNGFVASEGRRPAPLAVVSRPRNPEGDLWSIGKLLEWAEGADQLLVDETFREFAGCASVATERRRGLWATGSLTKFYAADDLRVGYVIAPEERAREFARFIGLVADELPDVSVAGALATLRHRREIGAVVLGVLERNRAALRRLLPELPTPYSPLFFDRSNGESGDRLALRALRASVLVCPGAYFGERRGVRVGMTRRSFPADLAAYRAVRDAKPTSRIPTGPRRGLRARSPRGGTARGKGARA